MSSSQQGFSLIEVLIAAAIVALIGAAFAPTLYAATKIWAQQSRVAQLTEEDRVARRVLRTLAEGAVHPAYTGGDIRFVGDAQSAEMIVRTESGDLEQIGLVWQARADGFALMLRVESFGTDNGEVVLVELLSQLDEGTFQYIDARTGDRPRDWQPSWARERLPAALRVAYRRSSMNAPSVLEQSMVVSFPANEPLHCPHEGTGDVCSGVRR